MAKYNRLGGLRREFHHVKVVDGEPGKPKYERAMFLLKHAIKGKSFCIPDSCGWKYIEPSDNFDVTAQDHANFEELKMDLLRSATLHPRQDFTDEMDALRVADLLNRNTGIMRVTAYSLVKCCQLLDITADGPGLCQLLMFIQDGLRELQVMRLPLSEADTEVGEAEVTLQRGGETKTWTEPLVVREGEVKVGMVGV
jgi:hypothetical protein